MRTGFRVFRWAQTSELSDSHAIEAQLPQHQQQARRALVAGLRACLPSLQGLSFFSSRLFSLVLVGRLISARTRRNCREHGRGDARCRRREKRISKIFLTRLRVAATLDCLSSSASLLVNGGKEVTLHYRFTIDSNWPLGTRVDICA